MAKSSAHIYKFGDFLLNRVERKLLKNSEVLHITLHAFDILQLLIERQGEVVTKNEILESVWKDNFVEEGNLTVYISKLRKLLNADKSEPYIETVFGEGYRFVARIEKFKIEDWEKLTSYNESADSGLNTSSGKPESIAVLPLRNENGDEEIDYLADGITESIINNISSIENLRVIARNTVFRYKDKDVDFQKTGIELNVQNILTGRIRIIRDSLIIGVELIKTDDNTQIWGTQINIPFDNIFKVQKHITQTVSENLRLQIDKKQKT